VPATEHRAKHTDSHPGNPARDRLQSDREFDRPDPAAGQSSARSRYRRFNFRAGLARILAAALFSAGVALGEPARFTAPDGPLTERFARPPAAHRILKIIHGWPDDPAQQDRLRATLLAQGFGGVVCNVSFDDYLESPARWRTFTRAVQAAKADGLALWLYDEKGYPSGNAGGLVLRDHPEWEAEGLLVADQECGPGPVTLAVPPGRLVLAAALPLDERPAQPPVAKTKAGGHRQRIELPAAVDGRITWTAPAGRWRAVVITRSRLFEGTHAEGNLWQKMPYVNLLQAAPTRRFLELTHGRYAGHLGPDLGRWFVAAFTDEPSLMSLFLRRMPYRPLPWSAELPAEFQRRRGYALEPVLPDLVLTGGGAAAARHRCDFWRTVGELVSENYFGQIEAYCRALNVPSGGHLLAEENIVNHVPLYGDFFRCLRRMGSPGIDCLTSVPVDVPWYIARLAASAAELEGRALVMCETSDHAQVWRPPGDPRPRRVVTEAEIRGTVNRLLAAGVNVITSYYSFTDLADDALRRLNEWVGRCATMLQGGHQVADIAVVYPVESLWTQFVPAPHWANASAGANRIGHLYRGALEALFEARRDFTVVDAETLATAKVEGDALARGPLRWRVVVLPGVDTLPWAAWRNLEKFVRRGGVVIALGALPANSEKDFPSRRVTRLSRAMFGEGGQPAVRQVGAGRGVWLGAGSEGLLPQVLDQALAPDVAVTPKDAPVRVTHRRVGGQEVYFLINDSGAPWQGTVRLSARGPGRQWDPANGTSRAIAAPDALDLQLDSYDAALLTFDRATPPPRLTLPAGPIGGQQAELLAVGRPLLSHGEFVRGEVMPDAARSEADRPAWLARATLTRGQVDTFLFVRFPLTRPADFADAALLEVESWVPEGQRTPAQLLVILHEEGGGDFLAETPRSLGVTGRETLYLPLSRFALAGWSQDADGRLDRARVSEVRVGWGGYYGGAGERVDFSVTAPRVLKAR
jgi:hypothetical protein